ncbi:MAG: hypothetical protein HY744_21745 [Deltaproteobacteria bacterium]|nr:hypothetical protein [Deltaproteobacteria bacterium]
MGRPPLLRSVLAAAAAAGSVCAPGVALGEPVPSLDLRGFSPPADPGSGLYLEPAVAPATLLWNAALWTSYAYRPVTLREPASGETAFDVVGHQVTGDVVANVGLAERVAIGADLPFVIAQVGDEANAASRRVLGELGLPRQALGDLKALGKVTLVAPTNGEFGGFALALHERLGVPTGDESSFLGEGHVTSETRVLAEYRLLAIAVHGALGFKYREKERFGCEALSADADCPTQFGMELPYGFALVFRPQAVGLDDAGRWSWFLESYGYLPVAPHAPFTNARVSESQLAVGARFSLGDLSLLGAVETALVGGVGTPLGRGTLALGWAPRTHDIDGDTIADDQDLCPDIEEDRDGFEDDDGCPEWDNDDDGVPDGQDRCEGQKEDQDGYRDDDGCPDPDNDGDGIPDELDACPDVPGLPSDNPALRGCPDPDPDREGVDGEADRCPDAAEDRDGFEDDDGCPDPDNDGDGIADAQDACRDEAGPPSGEASQSGCPDGDGDGIADRIDACPAEAGVSLADVQQNGCPDGDGDAVADRIDACPERKGAPSDDPAKRGCPKR